MKNKIKKIIIFIIIIIFGVLVVRQINVNKKLNLDKETIKEELVNYTKDDSKVNESDKLKETKDINGVKSLEINDLKIITKDNISELRATVTNKGKETQETFLVLITILDEKQNIIAEVYACVNKVESEKSIELVTAITKDITNAYDYKIKKI